MCSNRKKGGFHTLDDRFYLLIAKSVMAMYDVTFLAILQALETCETTVTGQGRISVKKLSLSNAKHYLYVTLPSSLFFYVLQPF